MLTLKAPIQLHITQDLTGNAESFCERIRGNYSLLGAHFTAKDLLFLMTAPPELPEQLGGMTTLVNQQNTVDVRSVTMEVVNHVVNRILLDGTQQFTYQDQVYITMALNRLGITNVAQFMDQVRQLQVETESTVHMTKLYQEELERILQRSAAGEAAPALPLPMEPQQDEPAAPQDPRVTLCMSILNRLKTTNLYETVYAFQRSWTTGANIIRNQELKLSEQLRFSNAVSLAQIKQQIYQQPKVHLLHHLNAYETGALLEAPKNEDEVIAQAAAAALITAVDDTVVQVLNRPQYRQEQWVQVKNALWQVAEHTLSRFETYHSQPRLAVDLSQQTELAWNTYVQELKEYQRLYWQMYPKAEGRTVPPMGDQRAAQIFLQHQIRESETEKTFLERSTQLQRTDTKQYVTQTTLRDSLRQTIRETEYLVPPAVQRDAAQGTETLNLIYQNETHQESQFQSWETNETVPLHGRTPEAEEDEPQERKPPASATYADRERILRQEREQQRSSEHLREIIRQQLGKEHSIPAPGRETMFVPADLRGGPAEDEETERVQRTLAEKTQLEQYITKEHDRQFQQRTIQELLGMAEKIHGGQSMPPEEHNSIFHNVAINQENLIHRLQSGETVTIEERAVINQLLSVPEFQRLWPSKRSPQAFALLRERTKREQERVVREVGTPAEVLPPVRERAETILPWLELPKQTEAQPALPIQPVPLTPREAEEQAPEILLEEMNRIDQHNRTVLQALQRERLQREPQLPPGPDLQRTMRDALRALNEPESVLREIYAQREQPAAMEHPELTPREQALLRQARPEERAVYEAVLAYQKDPEGTLAKGLLKPGSLGALHAQLQKAAQGEQPLVLEHPEEKTKQEQERLWQRSETVLKQFERLPVRRRSIVEETAPPPAVKIVHKQEAADVTEELLEQFKQQQTQKITQTDTREEVTRRQSHQVDVHQVERKVVAQTTEDLTELVNRTLARQMRTISDQVYRQMEKRLQAERSRRGRG